MCVVICMYIVHKCLHVFYKAIIDMIDVVVCVVLSSSGVGGGAGDQASAACREGGSQAVRRLEDSVEIDNGPRGRLVHGRARGEFSGFAY